MGGERVAAKIAATANTSTASTSTPWLPATRNARPPGTAAANVTTPDRNDRRELASTSSASETRPRNSASG